MIALICTVVQRALADNNENTALYLVMQAGIDQLKFEMPVYDEEGYDGWVDNGYVYVTPKGGNQETLLHYYSKESSSTNPTAWLSKSVDGTLVLRRDQGFSDVNITTGEKGIEIPKVPGKQYCKLYLTWTVPDNMRGKELTISWKVHKTGNMTEWSANVTINPTKVSFPSAPEQVKPEVTDPIIGYDAAHAGKMMLVYTMGTNNINSITAHYNEINGQHQLHKTIPVDPKMSGYLYLDADRCYKDLYLEAVYKDTENKLRVSRSDSMTLPLLHQPTSFTADLQTDGTVRLTWTILNAKWNDIIPGDSWDIQRNTTGLLNAEAKWTTINQVTYLNNDTTYSCIDQTFLDSYEGKPVYYRLRRSSTTIWDWSSGTYAQTSLPFAVRLPAVFTAQVKRNKWTDDEHSADFTFAFGSPQKDKNGRYLLRTAKDWETIAELAKTEVLPVNVIMVADIDLSDTKTMLGTQSHKYSGVFDGNGHTLTVNYKNMDVNYAAPFHRISNATIKNLHVQGLVHSEKMNVGGLVGVAEGKSTIQNCHVSTKVESLASGDVSSGGVVCLAEETTIMNTVFDGQLSGITSSHWGGFIGVVTPRTKQYINNCLFTPSKLNTLIEGCRTFARDYENSADIKNGYYTMPYDGVGTTTINNETYYVLRSTADWETIRQKVDQAAGNQKVNIILDGSFQINSMLGSSSAPYQGTFDGNGHTLSVSIKNDNSFAAPIQCVKGVTTIKNLNIQGAVTGGIHSSGLVGSSDSGTNLTIFNCRVSAHITTSNYYAGGFIGHSNRARITLRNDLFDGTIEAANYQNNSWAGAFIGWGESSTSNIIEHCLEHATYVSFGHTGLCYITPGSVYGKNGTNYSFQDWGEAEKATGMDALSLAQSLGNQWQTWNNLVIPKQDSSVGLSIGQGTDASDMTMDELKKALGDQWETSGNIVLPVVTISDAPEHVSTVWDSKAKVVLYMDKSVGGEIRYTDDSELTTEEIQAGSFTRDIITSCVDHDFRLIVERGSSKLELTDTIGLKVKKTETGETARYYFDNNIQIYDLKADTLQTSVSLTWKTTGQGDFFRILRYDKMEDRTDTLETNYGLTAYVDRTPRPQHVYVYTVEGVNQCEGEHVSSATVTGLCRPTGMVRGFVRMADGTAMAGVKVKATPISGNFVGASIRTTETDETGFFEIDSLIYQGAATYEISVEMAGDQQGVRPMKASFDDYTNLVTNINFIQQQYNLFSGYVMYEGTSVPVVGAQFERDGVIVTNGTGKPIISDSQGNFVLSIPNGSHTLRVVKDGHVFAEGGYYNDPDAEVDDERKYVWNKEVAGYIFWDQTRVTLRGRVVGGDIQGDKPLGKSLSKNNLGDSLTIVMQLEGDNASYLVRDQINGAITELHYDQPVGPADTCEINVYRHRIVVHPDNTTGEYLIPMLPVKYKITEVYAQGYPSLFQAGKVGETIDLTECVDGDTATWSRIYHATPTLDVRQFNLQGEDYMGIKSYTDRDNTGKEMTIELWDATKGYSFGNPVFMAGSPVIMLLAAEERYYKNNDAATSVPDIVHLSGGEVLINNALIGTNEKQTIKLDSLGEATYNFTPQNLTFTQEGDMALKALTMTLLYDGTYYDVTPMNKKPIQGYVLASKELPQGRRAVVDGGTYLIDILRDPPGAGSSAYIESGTKMNYTFTHNIKLQTGIKMNFGTSKGTMNYWNGVWAGEGAGEVVGNSHSVKTTDQFGFSLVTTYYNNWQYGYTFEATERISTSSGSTNVGRDADVFIGMTQNSILEDAIAVRAINEDTYNLLTTHEGGTFNINGQDFAVRQGTMKVLAQGTDSKGKKVYIVRDEVLKFKLELRNTFVHSAAYIEKELIPELFNLRNTLLLPMGTSEATAKEVANTKEHAMFISKVAEDDPYYGVEGYYTQVNPDKGLKNDSVSALNDKIRTWVEFLAINERDKLEAKDLVKSYDVDGRTSVTYSESFGFSDNESRYWQIPIITGSLGSISLPTPSFGGGSAIMEGTKNAKQEVTASGEGDDMPMKSMEFNVFSTGMSLKIIPVLYFDYNYNYAMAETNTKKVGFTLAPSVKSNLIVDVYRSKMDLDILKTRIDSMKAHGYIEPEKLFFQYMSDKNINLVQYGTEKAGDSPALEFLSYYDSQLAPQYRSFVYRTRGGATSQPYEGERKTKYYLPGTVLDEKTIEIDRLRIWADQASVSNVPYDEPARFTIHMANESEVPAQATEAFTYMISDIANDKGAKITVDGNPVAGEGHSVFIPVGKIVTKQVEIYPGADFDYENLVVQLFDPSDKARVSSCNLSAHFVPTAGKVNISIPGNKWVINTESQYDTRLQQYYMPVRIDGFDVNYRGFDHIELQYKLSTQGDKEWVNICSYYKDSLLLAKASGVCKMIEDDGHIMAQFYGEAEPVEQNYDLRAVCYCRHGNGYLTRSSEIISGIKDTRRPQLFGTPKPEDGILDIGEDIVFRFSEPIAGNYLRPLNNFQVIGQPNSDNITLSTSLRFNGGQGHAVTKADRNLSGKAFTVDVMLNPDKNGQPMTFFYHGDGSNQLELGLTADRRLSVLFICRDGNQHEKYSYESNETVAFNGFNSVRFVFVPDIESRNTIVSFYDGTKEIGTFVHPYLYEGYGVYSLGCGALNGTWIQHPYLGEMLEFRLWNRALSMDEMNKYSMKHLTGYEPGLLDNYPLSEGRGNYSFNRVAEGGDLSILGPTWKVPDGIGMRLDGEKGFRLNGEKFSRWSHEDYTLSFWFRTMDDSGTLLANGLSEDEAEASEHFRFYVDDCALNLRLGGRHMNSSVKVSDGNWHQAALVVSRSNNIGSLYVDQQLRNTFTVDSIGGIQGGYLAAGATYTGPTTAIEPISGHIDEIALLEMATSENYIKDLASVTPTGEELGLKVYLNFSCNEMQQNGLLRLMPTGISLKRYKDYATGEMMADRDTIVSQDIVDQLADRIVYAPMRDIQKKENIRYSFVVDGKDLLINLDVPDERIEKTNVYVLVKDVADLNGNLMASPAVLDLYAYRNPLRWNVKHVEMNAQYGETSMFAVQIKNLSGKKQRFTLDGLPIWMTASITSGSVAALDEMTVTFTISPYINIGNFDETICLIGENGMNEPLPIKITVRGEAPDWASVEEQLKSTNITMNVVARVEISGGIMNDSEDRIAVFGKNHQLLGVSTMESGNLQIGGTLAYLTIYNSSLEETPLSYEYYDASTGTIYRLTPDKALETFHPGAIVGTVDNPARLTGGEEVVQTLYLKKGWNWISFNIQPERVAVGELMNSATKWEVGDGLEIVNHDGSYSQIFYKSVYNPKDPKNSTLIWDNNSEILNLDPTYMYRFYSSSEKKAYFAGWKIFKNFTVTPGWNRIGFLSSINLPLGRALADYTDKASAGDIIKNQSEFAMLTMDGQGNKSWRGTLKYMRTGEGYMLKNNGKESIDFAYPAYIGESLYTDSKVGLQAPAFQNTSSTSMTVVAVADGIQVEPGDVLTAWRGAEPCGKAVADEERVFYLNVGDADAATKELSFTVERDEEVIASAGGRQMQYVPDAALGTPDKPTAIRFLNFDTLDEYGWYSLDGILLQGKPNRPGVYIHHHEKVIIK